MMKNIAMGNPQMSARRDPSAFDWKSWLAIVIATVAAIFTGALWWETHHKVAKNNRGLLLRPSVFFYIQDDDSEARIGLAVVNSGPGIAIVKSVTYYVDRKAMTDSADALRGGQLDPQHDHGTDLESDDSIGVNQTLWLLEYQTKDKKERERFLDFIDDHIAAKIGFCSIAGDQCREICSAKGWCG